MYRTRRSATLLSIILTCAISTSAIANVSEDSIYQPPNPPEGGISVWFSDANYLNRAPTQLIGIDKKVEVISARLSFLVNVQKWRVSTIQLNSLNVGIRIQLIV